MVFILQLDVLVDVLVSSLLVLDERVQALVHGHLKISVVVNVLYDIMNGVFEAFNDALVVSDNVTVRADSVHDQSLAHSQVLDDEAQAGIDLVILLEPLVHGLGALSQILNLELLRGDIPAQVLDFLVEHKLELL